MIDLIIGVFSGVLIAFAVCQVIPTHWNMFAGMFAGGAIGMALKFALLVLLAPFFGAFEVMIPLSLITMSVGMMSGMAAAQGGISHALIISGGGAVGLTIAVILYYSNKKLTAFK